jgi:hypothetical protein
MICHFGCVGRPTAALIFFIFWESDHFWDARSRNLFAPRRGSKVPVAITICQQLHNESVSFAPEHDGLAGCAGREVMCNYNSRLSVLTTDLVAS